MLIPSKNAMYTPKWKALGQRVLYTQIVITLSNGVLHLISLNWVINEQTEEKCWLELSTERLVSFDPDLDKDLIPQLDIHKPFHQLATSMNPMDVQGRDIERLCIYSQLIPKPSLIDILIQAEIIEKCSKREGLEILKTHIKNVDNYIKNKNKNTIKAPINAWLEDQGYIGVQRLPVHESLFSSNVPIESCNFY